MKTSRIPTCHPDRKHEAKGLCHSCYNYSVFKPTKEQNQRRNATPAAKARKVKWAEKQSPDFSSLAHIKSRYGLSKEDLQRYLLNQGNKCKICLTEFKDNYHVDHNHKTGEVRGLLCMKCNLGIGFLDENPFRFSRALHYLVITNSITSNAIEWFNTRFVDMRKAPKKPELKNEPMAQGQKAPDIIDPV